MKKNIDIDLGALVAVIFASFVISGSIVYFGAQQVGGGTGVDDEYLAVKIQEGIDTYIQAKNLEAEESARKVAVEKVERTKEMAQNVPQVSASDDHIFGNPDAPISLIEYSDFQCPFCQRFHATAQEVVEKYEGQVNWVYRHYPLSFHEPAASRQAVASECAAELGGSEAFWIFTEALFVAAVSDDDGLISLATGLGLDDDSFTECLKSGRYDAKIQRQIAEGSASGVEGTPGTVVLHNETGDAVLVEGAQPFSVFKQVLDEML